MKSTLRLALGMAIGAIGALAGAGVSAEPIRHPTATFAGLDKITGRIINFDVAVDETVQFGALQVTPRVCNTRPQTEAPQTTSFVEVDEQAAKPSRGASKPSGKQEAKQIFSGWMFAASPGLHGVEHPVYDVWLVDCKGGKENAQTAAAKPEKPAAQGARRIEPAAPAPVENQPIGPADQSDGAAAVEAPPAVDDVVAEPERPQSAREQRRQRRQRARARREPQDSLPEAPPSDPFQPF